MEKTIEERLRFVEIVVKDMRNDVEAHGLKLENLRYELNFIKQELVPKCQEKAMQEKK